MPPYGANTSKDSDGKPTIKGADYFSNIARGALHQEQPVCATEILEAVFYDEGVCRARGERMAAYIIRRRRELDNLCKLSSTTAVPDDLTPRVLIGSAA